MSPFEGNQVPVNTEPTTTPDQNPVVGETVTQAVEQVAQVAAAASGIDYEKSYNALLQEYNDTKNAYEVLKQDFAAMQQAVSKHGNVISHLLAGLKEFF